MSDEFYAYVIISAHGVGNVGGPTKRHNEVWETIPSSVREALVVTDDEEDETTWYGELTEAQWRKLRDEWYIEPENCGQTLGMLTEHGHMWALCDTSDGMDWNMGGITPVDYVDVYFCCQDEDMELANEA